MMRMMIVWVACDFDGRISNVYDTFEDAEQDRMDYIERFSGPMKVEWMVKMAKQLITEHSLLSSYT